MKIAVIPARGGSKRIPKKNLKPFAGKPVIAYSIETALRSGLFERVVVSTDSEEIAETARSFGAETPFLRPAELASDTASTQDALLHAFEALGGLESGIESLCCVYPAAPTLRASDLAKAYGKLEACPKAQSVYSVTSFPFPIFRAVRIAPDGFAEMLWPEHELTRSNDLPEAYHDAGQFYWVDAAGFAKTRRLLPPGASLPYVLPRFLVQDVDDEEDWLMAELLYEAAKARGLLD